MSCVRQLEQVKKAPYCIALLLLLFFINLNLLLLFLGHYLRLPTDGYRTLDFAKFNEIYVKF